MKINKLDIELQKFDRAYNRLAELYNNYSVGNFHLLGEICKNVVLLQEFSISVLGKHQKDIYNLSSYFCSTYQNDFMLVLSDKSPMAILRNQAKVHEFYAFTRNRIVKYLRGAVNHGVIKNIGKNYSEKRRFEFLDKFIFEEDKLIFPLWAVTRDFIRMYGISSTNGMHDSAGPYREDIKKETGETIRLSLVESLIFGIVIEIYQKTKKNVFRRRLIIESDLAMYKTFCNEDLYLNLKNQLDKFKRSKNYIY